ncbi:DUF6285 domain-containing protein [Methylobacterium sp. A54F]
MDPTLPDPPAGAALLDVARRALLDEVAPALTGRQRYVALMAANALGIAMREIEQAQAAAAAWAGALALSPEATPAGLAAAIRAGRHDGDPALHAALCGTAEVAAGIWKPARDGAPAP